jgi:hypothetical protein
MNNYDYIDSKANDYYAVSFKNNILDNVREKLPGNTHHRISNRIVDRDIRERYFNEDVLK